MSGHHEMSECPEAVTDTPSDTRVLYEKCFDRFMACITGHSCTQIYCFYLLTIRSRSHKRRRKFKLKCPINSPSFKERQVDWKPPYTALLVTTFTTLAVPLSVIRRPLTLISDILTISKREYYDSLTSFSIVGSPQTYLCHKELNTSS